MGTDQLQDAELDAAVARSMGKQPQLRPDAKGVMHCMVPYPQDCAPDAMVVFRPSRGGAAAWEVLEWVRGREFRLELSSRPNGDCVAYLYRDVEDDASGSGPTDAIALCRAVVALGEAG